MTCRKCLRFPVPTSNYEELAIDIKGHATLYVCKTCNQLIKLIEEERAPHYLSRDEAAQQFPEASLR
jgi:RNase P subunit RPR2